MPNYRFVTKTDDDRTERAEEFGMFNDQGAISFARRMAGNRAVEIWNQSRLVARVEPNSRVQPPLAANLIET